MSQPVSFGQAIRVEGTAAANQLVRGRSANLLRVVIPAGQTGTVTFYDAALAAGTAATNLVMSIPNTVGTTPTSVEVGATFKNGIVASKGGTVDMVIVVE